MVTMSTREAGNVEFLPGLKVFAKKKKKKSAKKEKHSLKRNYQPIQRHKNTAIIEDDHFNGNPLLKL